jgi:uncharacterized protein (TIGR02466 family)
VQHQVFSLFPTPVLRVGRLLDATLVAALAERVEAASLATNAKSSLLAHTSMLSADADPGFREAAARVQPLLVDFGSLLFGENLAWTVKEVWTNVLETGGHQAMHSHANSFISGVIYLTACHPSARTVFHRAVGGHEFVFSNVNPRARIGPFNGGKWVLPEANPGDLVLFPSYLLHAVPANEGGRRITIAFNAIPDRLDNFGYTVRFSS